MLFPQGKGVTAWLEMAEIYREQHQIDETCDMLQRAVMAGSADAAFELRQLHWSGSYFNNVQSILSCKTAMRSTPLLIGNEGIKADHALAQYWLSVIISNPAHVCNFCMPEDIHLVATTTML